MKRTHNVRREPRIPDKHSEKPVDVDQLPELPDGPRPGAPVKEPPELPTRRPPKKIAARNIAPSN